jgi:hypothetical protein
MLGGENKIRFYSYQAIVIAFSAAAGLFIGIGLANIYWKRKLRKKPRR